MPTVVELIWLLFLFVGTVLGARLKTSTWLLMDTVISFLFILPTFPFATESQRMETEGLTVDTAHGWLAQLYLGYALMPSVAWFGLRHSSFQICELALLSARVLGAGLGAVLMAVAHWQHNFFNSTHLYYAVLGNVAWALVNAVQLYKIDVSKRKQLLVSTPSKVNFYLQIDVAFSLLYALPDLLAPRFALSLAQMEPDGLHVHLLQVSAALHIGTAALSGLALYFRDNEEKKAVLLGRVVYTTGVSIDVQHEYLVTARVALLAMPALTWLLSSITTDTTCRTAILVSRLVGYGLTAVFMIIEHWRLGIFSRMHVLYSLVPCCLWVFVMTVQLLRTGGRVSTSVRTTELNQLLKYDLTVMLVFAAADIIAPRFFGHFVGRTVEPLHAFLHRINGALALGAAALPAIGQRFMYRRDKRNILVARVVTCTGWLLVTVVGYQRGRLPATDSTLAFMAQSIILMIPALIGCLSGAGRPVIYLPNPKHASLHEIFGKMRSSFTWIRRRSRSWSGSRSGSPSPTRNSIRGIMTRSRSRSRSLSRSKPRPGSTLGMVLRPRR